MSIKEKIEKSFAGTKAWAYAVFFDAVAIGCWDGAQLVFHQPIVYDDENVLELRVFDGSKELRCVRLPDGDLAERLMNDETGSPQDKDVSDLYYAVYGEKNDPVSDGWSERVEQRGGSLFFPADLDPKDTNLWLKIRNYLSYVPVPVGEAGKGNDDIEFGKGTLSVTDYRFAGFFLDNEGKQEVKL